MWIGHWGIGIVFYSALSTAIWTEGVPALQSHKFGIEDFSIQAPTLRTLVCLCGFAVASGVQHDCHAYLFSLKKPSTTTATKTAQVSDYKMPSHPAFQLTLTPHYFAECCVYVSLTFLAAPVGAWINGTMACALVFVVVNLGVTAIGTREWYEKKFGREAVKGRASMVPFIF
jgi:3-oxo-5-alpha-steroid 4-dehydrogenase 3